MRRPLQFWQVHLIVVALLAAGVEIAQHHREFKENPRAFARKRFRRWLDNTVLTFTGFYFGKYYVEPFLRTLAKRIFGG